MPVKSIKYKGQLLYFAVLSCVEYHTVHDSVTSVGVTVLTNGYQTRQQAEDVEQRYLRGSIKMIPMDGVDVSYAFNAEVARNAFSKHEEHCAELCLNQLLTYTVGAQLPYGSQGVCAVLNLETSVKISTWAAALSHEFGLTHNFQGTTGEYCHETRNNLVKAMDLSSKFFIYVDRPGTMTLRRREFVEFLLQRLQEKGDDAAT